MRNAEDDDGMKAPEAGRAARRRKQALVAVVGLTAVLSGATVAVNHWSGNDERAVPVKAADAASADPSIERASTAPKQDAASASPAPSPSLPKDATQRIAEARAAAAKDSVPVLRPLPPPPVAELPDEAVTVRTSGSVQKDKATMRVVSARGDLTGQRELAWVADRGDRVGEASCSQTIKLSNSTKPERKSNLLICWRTSAKKSVYTVVVDLDGDPSRQKSVATINAEWKKLD
uniref:hypothetical protein n=1 Tax=Paractinoplanes polyasparticus TaxID=2856853 RepID=UPI001C861DF8|nr:hypothetical protein [Actinoplanes polyasparticus]